MNEELYQRKIVDTIQSFEYFKLIHSSDKQGIESAYQHCIDEIDNIIKFDKATFQLAIISLLSDKSEYLKLEEVEIKLECAGIFGRRNFRIKIYELCYYFGILIREATIFLKNELIQLYQSNDEQTMIDTLSYSKLIVDIYDCELIPKDSKEMLRNIVTCKDIKTFEDLRIFLMLNSSNFTTPLYTRLISTLENIAVIQNTGLMYWSFNADLKTINDVRKTLLKYGFNDATLDFDDFLRIITPIKKENRQPKDFEIEAIQRASDTFLSKIGVDVINVISLSIAQSLNNV